MGNAVINIFTTQYTEDREKIPGYFQQAGDLKDSVIFHQKFKFQRKLPYIR